MPLICFVYFCFFFTQCCKDTKRLKTLKQKRLYCSKLKSAPPRSMEQAEMKMLTCRMWNPQTQQLWEHNYKTVDLRFSTVVEAKRNTKRTAQTVRDIIDVFHFE